MPAAKPPKRAPAPNVAVTLTAIQKLVRSAQMSPTNDPKEALAALLLLRELRNQLADWEPGLIDAARAAGASWADLAHPLGVASRQAAERRYLRVRPGSPGTTGEQRVRATRNQRASQRAVGTWARRNAALLRQIAGQIIALELPPQAQACHASLSRALADNDAAKLVEPLTHADKYVGNVHPKLAARLKVLIHQIDEIRRPSDENQ